ncbi:MAG: amidohydrolase family protein, partial [Planctomycetota bacterium]
MPPRDACAAAHALIGVLAAPFIWNNTADAATPPLLIRGGTVITMDGDDHQSVIENGAVVIRGDRIAWVGSADEAPPVADAVVVDAAGKFLIPGLIDAHVHLFDESQHDLYIANGVTTVFNMTGTPRILAWRDEIRAGRRFGPTIFTTGPQIKDEPLPVYDGIIAIRSAGEAETLVALHDEMGYSRLKIWSSLRPDIYDAIARAARDRGLPLTGHVPSRVG